jgi:hypothetical protein
VAPRAANQDTGWTLGRSQTNLAFTFENEQFLLGALVLDDRTSLESEGP